MEQNKVTTTETINGNQTSGVTDGIVIKTSEILGHGGFVFKEILNPKKHPAHFLGIYQNNELLGYLQYGYFSIAGGASFHAIEYLKNLSTKKGIGKALMKEFLKFHDRVLLQDYVIMDGVLISGYYSQFGFQNKPDSYIWHKGFKDAEIPFLEDYYQKSQNGLARVREV